MVIPSFFYAGIMPAFYFAKKEEHILALTVKKKFTPYNHNKLPNRQVKYIVIHWVGSASSAKNNADYFYSGDRQASAHYFVDDNECWQIVKESDVAWAVGGGPLDQGSPYAKYGKKYFGKCTNSNSISIEMCCAKDKNGKLYITDKTIENTGKLVRGIQKRWNIDDEHVISHFLVNGKICPGPYVEPLAWEKLHSILVGKYFKIRALGDLIAREEASLSSKQTRRLNKGTVYGIIDTAAGGTRGKTVRGDWVTITEKYAEKVK